MTDLTEQNLSKKNGKTFFYIKFPNGEVIQGDEFALGLYRMCNDGDKVKMLEQVPSYEQWQAKLNENAKLKTEYEKECHRADELEDSYWKAEKENTRLKELLKLARSSIDYHCALCREYTDGKILIAKIDEVLK